MPGNMFVKFGNTDGRELVQDDTLVFEQSSSTGKGINNVQYIDTNDPSPPGDGKIDFAAADSSEEIGATVTYTYIIKTDASAVQHHDYGLI